MANYRSYRDDASRRYLRDIGLRIKRDPIYPDLVFSLPEALILPHTLMSSTDSRIGCRRVVGLGLMSYAGKYSVVNPSDATYAAYLEALVVFVKWLLDQDYDIKLLLGDGDTHVIDEFKSLLEARFVTYDEERVIYQPIASVEEILSQLAATDVVVATRFHNVLLAFLLGKPVIAISFHHKCGSLMKEMGLSEYTHDINQMNAGRLIRQFEELERNSEKVERIIKKKVAESSVALDEQYDLLFNV